MAHLSPSSGGSCLTVARPSGPTATLRSLPFDALSSRSRLPPSLQQRLLYSCPAGPPAPTAAAHRYETSSSPARSSPTKSATPQSKPKARRAQADAQPQAREQSDVTPPHRAASGQPGGSPYTSSPQDLGRPRLPNAGHGRGQLVRQRRSGQYSAKTRGGRSRRGGGSHAAAAADDAAADEDDEWDGADGGWGLRHILRPPLVLQPPPGAVRTATAAAPAAPAAHQPPSASSDGRGRGVGLSRRPAVAVPSEAADPLYSGAADDPPGLAVTSGSARISSQLAPHVDELSALVAEAGSAEAVARLLLQQQQQQQKTPLRQGLLLAACRKIAELYTKPPATPNPDPDLDPYPSPDPGLDPQEVLCGEVLRSAGGGLLDGPVYGELAGLLWGRLRCTDPWFWSQLLASSQLDLPSFLPREIAALLEPVAACCAPAHGSAPARADGPGVTATWLEAAEERLMECAECIGPADATRVLSAFAAVHYTPARPCAKLLVAAAGAAFQGWRWTRGPPRPASSPRDGGAGGAAVGSRFRARGARAVADPWVGEDLAVESTRLSEAQLRTLLLAVAAVDGAYPGEAWLADWCAAYGAYLPTHGSDQDTPGVAGVAGGAAGVATPAAAGAGAVDAGGVAQLLYCLATLQYVPPEIWEAAALAAVQPGLAPWLALAAEIDPPTHQWALAPEPMPPGSSPPPPQAQSAAPLEYGERQPPLPLLKLTQLTWAVGALAAACPLPPPPQSAAAVRSSDASGAAAARAARRRGLRQHRRRVFGAALAALAAWGMTRGSVDAAAKAAEAAVATARTEGDVHVRLVSEASLRNACGAPLSPADADNLARRTVRTASDPDAGTDEGPAPRTDVDPDPEEYGDAAGWSPVAWAVCVRDVVWGLRAAGLEDDVKQWGGFGATALTASQEGRLPRDDGAAREAR